MHTLQEFVLRNLTVARRRLKAVSRLQDTAARRGAHSSMFESFIWLHLGTELGVFDLSAAKELVHIYFKELFDSLVSTKPTTVAETEHLFRGEVRIYDTPESSDLKATFPDFVIQIEDAMRNKDLFAASINKFTDVASLV